MRHLSLFAVPFALIVTGCASQPPADAAPAAAVAAPAAAAAPAAEAPKPKVTAELYEVYHENGRIYRFYDFADYQKFLKTDEVPYVLTRIGAGVRGETVVYSLLKKDADKTSGIPSIELIEGRLVPDEFYAEMVREGRIQVFSSPKEMEPVREHGEATFRYTDIGSGPNGETVIYVLDKKTADKRPDELIAKFRAKRGM